MRKNEKILTINGGSSSIKFSLYKIENPLEEIFTVQVKNIGSAKAKLTVHNSGTEQKTCINFNSVTHNEAAENLINWLEKQQGFNSITAIGHRMVHGMQHTEPEIISPELLENLKTQSLYDTEHSPEEIKLIEVFSMRYPLLQQVAYFDTYFHTSMPSVTKMLALPRRYYDNGIYRYGFHGLSYAYLLQELENVAGEEVAKGKIKLAHLGSGVSIAAVNNGKSIDSSMGFTPASGFIMGTRCGDIDPGVAWYLLQFEKLNPKQFNHLINHESGLLGISETGADMQALIEMEDKDSRAADAVELFCYQTEKMDWVLCGRVGGLETLVFSGGIDEHSPEVRSKTCDGLEFLGIELCEIKNMNNEAIISSGKSRVTVRVIKTNEEIMIARLVDELLNK